MGVMPQAVPFTRSDYMALPEGFPAELIDGQLCRMPAPSMRHQQIVRRLTAALLGCVDEERVYFAPIDLFLDDYNIFQPDVLVLSALDAREPAGAETPCPELVMEVLSPSTAHRDRDFKAARFLNGGVQEIWLVDPKAERIEIRTSAGLREVASGAAVSDTVPQIRIDLDRLFGS